MNALSVFFFCFFFFFSFFSARETRGRSLQEALFEIDVYIRRIYISLAPFYPGDSAGGVVRGLLLTRTAAPAGKVAITAEDDSIASEHPRFGKGEGERGRSFFVPREERRGTDDSGDYDADRATKSPSVRLRLRLLPSVQPEIAAARN